MLPQFLGISEIKYLKMAAIHNFEFGSKKIKPYIKSLVQLCVFEKVLFYECCHIFYLTNLLKARQRDVNKLIGLQSIGNCVIVVNKAMCILAVLAHYKPTT